MRTLKKEMRHRLFRLFFAVVSPMLGIGLSAAAQDLPVVSTGDTEVWYYIQFQRTGNVLAMQGEGQNTLTAVAKPGAVATQLWKVEADGQKFRIVSRSGQTLYLDGTNTGSSRFKTAQSPAAGAITAFDIYTSGNTAYEGLEISPSKSDAYAMNQVGSPAVGQQVGIWNKADANNVLQFVAADEMSFAYSLPKVSTQDAPVWYYIQFQNNQYLLTAKANQGEAKTDELSASQASSQLWRLEANGDGYSFFNKAGQQLYYGNNFVRAATAATGTQKFFIIESTSSLGGFEISTASASSGRTFFNQWQGAGLNKSLGLWDYADNSNVVRFIPEKDLVPVEGVASFVPDNRYTLWYTQPATNWMMQCLPLGEGQFGATVMGQIADDDIQFNDKTLWNGKLGKMTSTAAFGYYLNFGHLHIRTNNTAAVTNYVRFLDINDAVAGVNYTMGGVDYERRYIASHPDSLVAIRYTASKDSSINTTITMRNFNGKDLHYAMDGETGVITFAGTIARTGNNGAATPESYYAEARVAIEGGKIEATNKGIVVNGADAMTIYLRGMTDYDPMAAEYVSATAYLPTRVKNVVKNAQQKGWDELLAAQKADYHRLFNRCELTITDKLPTVSTSQLLKDYASATADNTFLEELYFAYGRYLLIGCARGVATPANLQGIWNNSNTPAWHGDIHSNINVEMNYWAAEPTNLSELHTNFTDYIYREACVQPQWRLNASEVANQSKGWAVLTESNIYGGGGYFGAAYMGGAAWFCSHLWQHYQYTLDREYLLTKAFPAMKSCAEFWLERLQLADDGTYEAPNDWSPEHGPKQNATAHSQQLIWDLFNNVTQAIKILGDEAGVSAEFEADLANKFAKLDKGTGIEAYEGKNYLKEWKYTSQFGVNSEGTWKTHRHCSHLMGLYPLSQITREADYGVFEAAANSAEARFQGNCTGWSLAWKIALGARAYKPEMCHNVIKTALHQSRSTADQQGGVYENLWDAHAPFQIDGNLGYPAGIAEMLLQSKTETLELLPALPTEFWPTGSVKGLRAVGDFTVSINWADGKLATATILSGHGRPCKIAYSGLTDCKVFADGKEVEVTKGADGNSLSFPTEAGKTYQLINEDAVGVQSADAAVSETVSTKYYSVNGVQQSRPTKGEVYVKVDTKANGKSNSTKMIY